MITKERILLESKAWREERITSDENYFRRISQLNPPKLLWISSTDTLVPVQEMINMEPGEVILYRNIASQIREDDMSLMTVMEEAILKHEIKHIMLCAYSHCSGVSDILDGNTTRPALNEWLKGLRELYDNHYDELKSLSRVEQEKLLNEMNIRQQVINLSKLDIIQSAWERNDYPKIIGWYFDLDTGLLREVFSLEKNHRLKQSSTLLDTVQR